MKRSNTSLAIILGILVAISIALGFWDGNGNEPTVDTGLFVIENIDQVDRIKIQNGDELIDCQAFSGGFMINDQFPMNQNLLTVLAAVFQQIRVERPLSGQEQQEEKARLMNSGSHVEVYDGEQLLLSFWAGGDSLKQNSYFATEEGDVYLVNLPGYASYLSGLFELPLSQWRSRTIFHNTWRSLESFSYQDFTRPQNDFLIKYQDPFFTVSGQQHLDSNKVMHYIQDLVSLNASALVDTTHQGIPWLELSTVDIDPRKSQTLTIYGSQSQPTVLGKSGDQYFTFPVSSLEPLMRDSEYFSARQ